MEQTDTTELLRECNSGIKMGIDSIDEMLPDVKSEKLRAVMLQAKKEHCDLGDETHALLTDVGRPTKEPHPIAKGISWLKTEVKLAADRSDETVADLITDGCDMGIKSLSSYLNRYTAADKDVRSITRRLIASEEKLRDGVREFLR